MEVRKEAALLSKTAILSYYWVLVIYLQFLCFQQSQNRKHTGEGETQLSQTGLQITLLKVSFTKNIVQAFLRHFSQVSQRTPQQVFFLFLLQKPPLALPQPTRTHPT